MIPKIDRVPEAGREGQRKLIVTRSDVAGLPVGADFTAEVQYDDGATVEGTPINRASQIEYLAASGTTTGTASVFNLAQEDFALFDGALIRVKFHVDTAAPFTLNVNYTGAIPVYDALGNGKVNYGANTWASLVYSSALNHWVAQGTGTHSPANFRWRNHVEIRDVTQAMGEAMTINLLQVYLVRTLDTIFVRVDLRSASNLGKSLFQLHINHQNGLFRPMSYIEGSDFPRMRFDYGKVYTDETCFLQIYFSNYDAASDPFLAQEYYGKAQGSAAAWSSCLEPNVEAPFIVMP